ncbi:MAG: APC family permease [Armatimonadetes bacterium]|nr:APC family permease [Armatimonadota bacterium]
MGLYNKLRSVVIGKPIASKHAHHERLPKIYGLPVFASDALSSVAYATEEILLVLVLGGSMAFVLLPSISLWLGALMLIVGFSYYQTIHAYPKGGGTYLVSTENLGSLSGRVAGASLLIDYVLTVAVSVSSGVAAIVSMNSAAADYKVIIAVLAVLVLMTANLRGAKESGALFAIPTYSFVALVIILIGYGLYSTMGVPHKPPDPAMLAKWRPEEGWHTVGLLLMLRAFAASCTALTGTEAIADGVQAFRAPEAKNASQTLIAMIVLLLVMFIGLGYLAFHEGVVPMISGKEGYQTVLAQIAATHFGNGSILFYTILVFTAAVLFLAANTAYADFPRLSSFIAKDGYLPRQLATVGDRLVFQNGIVFLSLASIALLVIYKADTHSLIPLYAMGVFISFTLSQLGMGVKFLREKAPLWQTGISFLGSFVTFVVLIILLVTKFAEGAWLIVIALAVMLFIFSRIKNHYVYLAGQLDLQPGEEVPEMRATTLLLVPRIHRGILQAIGYARSTAKDCRAIHVTMEPGKTQAIKESWDEHGGDMPLVILESPFRSLIQPVINYIDQALEEDPNQIITVIVPQAVPKRWWQGMLHNNIAVALKIALASKKNVVITNVRYFLK